MKRPEDDDPPIPSVAGEDDLSDHTVVSDEVGSIAADERRKLSLPPTPMPRAPVSKPPVPVSKPPPAPPSTAPSTQGSRRTTPSPEPAPPPVAVARPRPGPARPATKSKTLIGVPPPNVALPGLYKSTPISGTPKATPEAIAQAHAVFRSEPPTALSAAPKTTPAGGLPAPLAKVAPVAVELKEMPAAPIVGGTLVAKQASSRPPPRVESVAPPAVRIPQGGLLGSATKSAGPDRSLLCEVLIRDGAVTQELVDRAISVQEERGGQIGRILISMGACTEAQIARALVAQLKLRKENGYVTDISAAARLHKEVAGLEVLTRPSWTVATLLAVDLFSLLFAALVATTVHWLRLGEVDWSSWLVVGPSVALCVLTYVGLELYSPMAKSTPDEIRDIVFGTSLVHLGATLLSSLGDLPIVAWGIFVRGVWFLGTLLLLPVARSFVRNKLSVQPWWGIPVCVLGAAKTGRLVIRTLKAQPRSGLKPVMILDDDPQKHGTLRASFTNEQMDVYSVNVSASAFMSESQARALAADLFDEPSSAEPPSPHEELAGPISSDHIPVPPSSWHFPTTGEKDAELPPGPDSTRPKRTPKDSSAWPRGKYAEVEGIPIVGELSLAPVLAQRLKIPYAVVAMPGVDSPTLLQIIERIGGRFSHLLIIPDLFGFATLGVPAKNLGGILGVEVRQQLLLPGPRLAKRIMDAALTGVGVLFVLPFLLLIALLIKLDSRGPVFYTQLRLGKDGEHFKAYKFRTMHGDGEERLKAILDADPALRAEYDIYHKLKKDPRVTRIGRILRKYSLDEFPQLLNVIKGDMSLVGPRPYIERELTEMGGQEKIILRAPPGMTGMWQVSDRNATSFAQRVQIDVYYVRNWSPWLDIHILAKTIGVVLKGSGV